MPLEDTTTIDSILPPDADGKVCLIIIDAGVTTDPAVRLQFLSEKIQTYAHEIWNGGFIHDYPDKQAGDFIIKVVCQRPPTPAMQEIISIGEIGHQIPVVFEVEAGEPEPRATEPEYLWSNVLAQAFAEFTNDQKFYAKQAEMLIAALASAGTMNFVYGRAYRSDGTAGEIVSVSQAQPTEETAGLEVVAQARAMGQQLGLEFDYWFVIYTMLRETEDSEESQLWVVAEGWKRGQNRGISIGQIFQRGDPPHPVGEPQLIGIVPVDVFTAPVATIPRPEVKPSPRPDFPWRAAGSLLAILAVAAAGYIAYQKYPMVRRTAEPASPAPTSLQPTNANVVPAPAPAVEFAADLTIQSAEFVSGKNTLDVTDRIKDLLRDQPDGFKPDAKTLGIDPPAAKRKHLNVRYSYEGTNYSFNFPIGKKLSIQNLIDRTRPDK